MINLTKDYERWCPRFSSLVECPIYGCVVKKGIHCMIARMRIERCTRTDFWYYDDLE